MNLSRTTVKACPSLTRLDLIAYLRKEIERMKMELQRMSDFASMGGEHYMLSLGMADYTAEQMILEDELTSVLGEINVQDTKA